MRDVYKAKNLKVVLVERETMGFCINRMVKKKSHSFSVVYVSVHRRFHTASRALREARHIGSVKKNGSKVPSKSSHDKRQPKTNTVQESGQREREREAQRARGRERGGERHREQEGERE